MTSVDAKIELLRKKMAIKYLGGEREEALELSRCLDKLIALAQRESLKGEWIIHSENKPIRQ